MATSRQLPSMGAVFGMLAALTLTPLGLPGGAAAQDTPRSAFRVCQDPVNLPFSDAQGNGFENKIAQVLADGLGLPVEYYNFPQRLGFIRNTLRYRLPGEAFACDVVMGIPERFDQAASTRPYYRSAYALILGSQLADVDSVQDFLALPPHRRDRLRIGVYDRSPASNWLARNGMLAQSRPYPMLNADPAHYPGELVERDLARGDIDAAVLWGPIAGYFSRRLPEARLRVHLLASEPGLPLAFGISLGVRHGEARWKDSLEELLERYHHEIQGILESFGVPLLPIDDEAGP